MAPLLLRGRALGVLLAVDAPEQPLLAARAPGGCGARAGQRLHGRLRRDAPAQGDERRASEIQQNLLPPRIARISGGILAGNVLPGYEIGGDWFDYIENPDGAWIGVADSKGKGTTAAALGASRSAPSAPSARVNAQLDAAALAMHHTMLEVAVDGAFVNVILGALARPVGRSPGRSPAGTSRRC